MKYVEAEEDDEGERKFGEGWNQMAKKKIQQARYTIRRGNARDQMLNEAIASLSMAIASLPTGIASSVND